MGNLDAVLNQLKEEQRQAQQQIARLEQAIDAIQGLVTNTGSASKQRTVSTVKRPMSEATRRKLSLAQKARWANAKKPSQSVSNTGGSNARPAKRIFSVATRRKLAAAQRARWAKVRTAAKKAA